MSRPLRIELAGGLYHVTSRGDRREDIYSSDADRLQWLAILAEVCEQFNWRCHAWCQMTNHYHLVVRPQLDGEMSRYMKWIGGTHTMRYHAHYHSEGMGHVYQQRFKSFPVQDDGHFFTVCR